MPKTYTYITTVKSFSSKKLYTIKKDEQGKLSCSCPAWIFNQRGNRTCKHIDHFLGLSGGRAIYTRYTFSKGQEKEIKNSLPKNVEIPDRFSMIEMD